MIDIDLACKAEIEQLKIAICDFPECGKDYGAQAFGVFRLWMRLAGYLDDDENTAIKEMREYAEGVGRFGALMQKKAIG